jgi:hypothetical protein
MYQELDTWSLSLVAVPVLPAVGLPITLALRPVPLMATCCSA